MLPRFTLADLDHAHTSWACTCGPGAFAAVLGLTLDEAKPHFMPAFPGYTNVTRMRRALASASQRFTVRRCDVPFSRPGEEWPRWGLCRIQWEGPWTAPGANPRWACTHTHWVGSCADPARGVGVFDVNALANGSGWCSLEDWSTHLAPALTADIKRATGGWHVTHAIEVSR